MQVSRHIGRHVISTALEHSSVGGALSALQQQGCEVDLVDIRRDGTIDLEQLRELLRKDTVLVSVCAADSELGTAQPIREIGTILKEYPNCRFHVDATQAVGKAELVLDGVDNERVPERAGSDGRILHRDYCRKNVEEYGSSGFASTITASERLRFQRCCPCRSRKCP